MARALVGPLVVPLVAASLLGTSACVPIPFGSPPIRAAFSAGGAGGRLRASPTDHAGPHPFEPLLGGRAAVHPLALAPSLIERPADFGIGYLAEGVPRSIALFNDSTPPTVHGPFLEAHWWPWRERSNQRVLRMGALLRAEALLLDGGAGTTHVGGGVSAGVTFELASFVDSPFTNSGASTSNGTTVVGHSYGEGGVGLEVSGGFREVDDVRYGTVMLNLTLRIPASFGIALVPLPSLLK